MRSVWMVLGWAAMGMVTLRATAADERPLRSPGESCDDQRRNGPESDVDCGGDCAPCGYHEACLAPRDCASGRCSNGTCIERPWRKGEPVPPEYTLAISRHDPAASLRLTGALFFGVSYLAAYGAALASPRQAGALYVPILGPWIGLGALDHPVEKTLAVSDGALQAAGGILFVAGAVGAGKQLLRTEPMSRVQLTPRPLGLDLTLRF